MSHSIDFSLVAATVSGAARSHFSRAIYRAPRNEGTRRTATKPKKSKQKKTNSRAFAPNCHEPGFRVTNIELARFNPGAQGRLLCTFPRRQSLRRSRSTDPPFAQRGTRPHTAVARRILGKPSSHPDTIFTDGSLARGSRTVACDSRCRCILVVVALTLIVTCALRNFADRVD